MKVLSSITIFIALIQSLHFASAGSLRGSSTQNNNDGNKRFLAETTMSCPGTDAYVYKDVDVGSSWKCKSTSSDMRVFYPADTSKDYNVVLFMRGSGGWDDGYNKWLCDMAKQNLIVLAPMGKGKNDSNDECKANADLQTAYDWAKTNLSDATGGKSISSTARIGVGGHSAGAHHIPAFLQNKNIESSHPISAVLFSHGGRDVKDYANTLKGVPTMFMSSHEDTSIKGNTAKDVKSWYDALDGISNHRFFISLRYGPHGEPHEECNDGHCYQLSPYTGAFFGCYLNKDDAACTKYYETENKVDYYTKARNA